MAMNRQHRKKKALYSFEQARRMARQHGFESKEEFLDYDCPGAYQLPKNPDEIWTAEWRGWRDFLGICWGFEEGRSIAQSLKVDSMEFYLKLFDEKKINESDPASLLPYRPDLQYKKEWRGWDDWLNGNKYGSKLHR
ncbi:unnamed protein product [Cylindrotheca closterium]|uniref:Uncharacterized protein n=1 Tax=Cylindrotheca closterium TaxID=2856 RepID=A0AAD2CJH3_9STRA|nr:unnamed protein product [Cylindrotheca closterium]